MNTTKKVPGNKGRQNLSRKDLEVAAGASTSEVRKLESRAKNRGRSFSTLLVVLVLGLPATVRADDGYLGVRYEQTGQGVAVEKVGKNTPAQKAGLKRGDIITNFNATPVDDQKHVERLLRQTAPGTAVTLSLLRKGKPLSLSVVLGSREQYVGRELDGILLSVSSELHHEDPSKYEIRETGLGGIYGTEQEVVPVGGGQYKVYELQIKLDDIVYFVRYAGSEAPNWIENDPVHARFDKRDSTLVYLRRPDGKNEQGARIVRRVRDKNGAPVAPPTAAPSDNLPARQP
jgi:membrane-associated protease RseP (regulator of RpoE activity)